MRPFSRAIGNSPGDRKQQKHNFRHDTHRYTAATRRKVQEKLKFRPRTAHSAPKATVYYFNTSVWKQLFQAKTQNMLVLAWEWHRSYFDPCRTFDVRKHGCASREERKWSTRSVLLVHAHVDPPSAKGLQLTLCKIHIVNITVVTQMWIMCDTGWHNRSSMEVCLAISSFSLTLSFFNGFCTTWWHLDLLGTLWIRRY